MIEKIGIRIWLRIRGRGVTFFFGFLHCVWPHFFGGDIANINQSKVKIDVVKFDGMNNFGM